MMKATGVETVVDIVGLGTLLKTSSHINIIIKLNKSKTPTLHTSNPFLNALLRNNICEVKWFVCCWFDLLGG